LTLGSTHRSDRLVRDPGRLPRVHLSAAAEQAWPPFVLVSGLLLIGLVAHRDGLFEQTGRSLQNLAGPPVVLFAACLLLVAVVTAVLNLDTAVVFLTPVLVHAARGRGIEEEAFLYGAVYMANASSLYLLGSNLTNLLVLDHQPISGSTFAARMLVIALAATLATALGLFVLFRRRLRAATSQHPPRASWDALGLGLPGAWPPPSSQSRFATPRSPSWWSDWSWPRSRSCAVGCSGGKSYAQSGRSCS
jgi:Na+/H+ antiporter NhaD/arsenite permease-like protein